MFKTMGENKRKLWFQLSWNFQIIVYTALFAKQFSQRVKYRNAQYIFFMLN